MECLITKSLFLGPQTVWHSSSMNGVPLLGWHTHRLERGQPLPGVLEDQSAMRTLLLKLLARRGQARAGAGRVAEAIGDYEEALR